MYAYDSGSMAGSGEAADVGAWSLPQPTSARGRHVASGYGADGGPNWIVVAAIVAFHVVALVALVKLDVIHIIKPKAAPLVVNLLAEPPAPPPAPKPDPVPETRIQSTIVAPTPVVQIAEPAPPPIATAPVAPPRTVIVAPAAPVAPAVPVAATNLDDTVLSGEPPRYPIESRRKREQGTVTLRLIVGPEGIVTDIVVARSSGFDRLDDAALKAVRKWRWKPMVRDGKPLSVIGIMSIPFNLTN